MSLRSMASRVTSGAALFASITTVCYGQHTLPARVNSASHVAAEMTLGKLNPAESKRGDVVALKLKEDVRSNGEVILKKGTTITGIVENVGLAEGTGKWKNEAQAMIEIEWRVPAPEGRGVQSVSFAIQSVIQVNPASVSQPDTSSDDVSFARDAANFSNSLGGRPNNALLSMPSVMAADEQTSSNIETTLGTQTSGRLFRVGHGQLVSSGGSKEPVELYSHLSNDTVITSPSSNFEISSGAQMQMLVGVNRK